MDKKLTPEEQIKVNAALDIVNDSILWGIYADIDFVKNILPDHYDVHESKKRGSIHCVSSTGIRQNNSDKEDEEHWGYIMKAIKKQFGKRFQEVDHNTCFCHIDFTIYLRERTGVKNS